MFVEQYIVQLVLTSFMRSFFLTVLFHGSINGYFLFQKRLRYICPMKESFTAAKYTTTNFSQSFVSIFDAFRVLAQNIYQDDPDDP